MTLSQRLRNIGRCFKTIQNTTKTRSCPGKTGRLATLVYRRSNNFDDTVKKYRGGIFCSISEITLQQLPSIYNLVKLVLGHIYMSAYLEEPNTLVICINACD